MSLNYNFIEKSAFSKNQFGLGPSDFFFREHDPMDICYLEKYGQKILMGFLIVGKYVDIIIADSSQWHKF